VEFTFISAAANAADPLEEGGNCRGETQERPKGQRPQRREDDAERKILKTPNLEFILSKGETLMAKEKSRFENEGHDDPATKDMPRLSKGELQQIGTAIPLVTSPTSVNSKTGHTGTGEE
jgi:hypothetical protein